MSQAIGDPVLNTRWWHVQDDRVVCDLCPRRCSLHEGQRGFCFVRQNLGGRLALTTYGRSSGFCIDPIEKKPLNHFLPGTPILSFGTAGCNLGCKFCQNWSISKSREFDALADCAGPEEIAEAALRTGCRSVAFTYNDPVIWAEYAIDTARSCHARGLKTVAVTAGYITEEAREPFFAEMDAANVDLKGFTENFYQRLTLSHLQPVLDTLRWLKEKSRVWFEITNLMIPEENDSPQETADLCQWIVDYLGPDVPVHFTAFHPDFRLRNRPATPTSTLLRARDQALKAGIRYAYVGNVHDVAGQSTWCPNCRELLIERDWYELGDYRLNGNACARCGAHIAGVFEDRPGNWGAKRQPVRISAFGKGVGGTPPNEPETPTQVQHSREDTKEQDLETGEEPTSSKAKEPSHGAPELTASQARAALRYAREAVNAAVQRRQLPAPPSELQTTSIWGAFVTLERDGQLRSCKGRFGGSEPLGSLLGVVAADSALNDPRFPSISPQELSRLTVEVSLLFAPQSMRGSPRQIASAVEVGRHGLILQHPQGCGLLLPQVATRENWDSETFLRAVARKAGLPPDAWQDEQAVVSTFEAVLLQDPAPLELSATPEVRAAARAGQFYPADPIEMASEIDRYLGMGQSAATDCRAVLLPHAGWIYCGEVLGKTLAACRVPRRVIILSPKHTPYGANWSVSSATGWSLPGGVVSVDVPMRERLLTLWPELVSEAEAHALEHGVEVIVPFLQRMNPQVVITPVVLGPTSYAQTERIARALALAVQESPEPVLLVISSDLNHFAPEPENRRRDLLAVHAVESGDPAGLYDTVYRHDISMCGVIPAVCVLRTLHLVGPSPTPHLVQYANSAAASGDFGRVVGYAGLTVV